MNGISPRCHGFYFNFTFFFARIHPVSTQSIHSKLACAQSISHLCSSVRTAAKLPSLCTLQSGVRSPVSADLGLGPMLQSGLEIPSPNHSTACRSSVVPWKVTAVDGRRPHWKCCSPAAVKCEGTCTYISFSMASTAAVHLLYSQVGAQGYSQSRRTRCDPPPCRIALQCGAKYLT